MILSILPTAHRRIGPNPWFTEEKIHQKLGSVTNKMPKMVRLKVKQCDLI